MAKERPTFDQWLPLVRHVIREKFQWAYMCGEGARSRITYDDLFQEGCVALIDALNGFDPDKGTFKTYAYMAILNRLARVTRDALRKTINTKLFSEISTPDEDNWSNTIEDTVDEEPGVRHNAIEWSKNCIDKLRRELGKRKTKLLMDHYVYGVNLKNLGERMHVTSERARTLIQEWLIRAYEILEKEEENG